MGQPHPSPDTATDVAHRFWERAAGDASAPEEVAAAVERICAQLRAGLGRWIGVAGYQALLDRALGLARARHPALGSLSCLGEDGQETVAAVRAHGAGAVAAGLMAVVAALIELLGRIIGVEMAVRLVEQIALPSPHGVRNNDSPGGRHG
jgi:hypothetical protein